MKKLPLAGAAVAVVAVVALACSPDTTVPTGPGMTPRAAVIGATGRVEIGPYDVTNAEDIGTCNNVWAYDSYKKLYTITSNADGSFHIQVDYKAGRFVSVGGMSPGACETGTNNGNTVAAGVTGNMKQQWDADFTGTPIPDATCDASACASASGLLSTLFTGASSPDWTYSGVYHAGEHGTWFDTWNNWPLNDTGDIQ